MSLFSIAIAFVRFTEVAVCFLVLLLCVGCLYVAQLMVGDKLYEAEF